MRIFRWRACRPLVPLQKIFRIIKGAILGVWYGGLGRHADQNGRSVSRRDIHPERFYKADPPSNRVDFQPIHTLFRLGPRGI